MITIDHNIKAICPHIQLGVLTYEAAVGSGSDQQAAAFNRCAAMRPACDGLQLAAIQDTRNAYQSLGKSPSRYRNASEAMLRRIGKRRGLYSINNIVDINNMVSIETGFSIGSYDRERISRAARLKRAPIDAHYEGIGKTSVNIACLPVLYDARGNPTSESQRTMLTEKTHAVVSVIYAFTPAELPAAPDRFQTLLERFTDERTVVD